MSPLAAARARGEDRDISRSGARSTAGQYGILLSKHISFSRIEFCLSLVTGSGASGLADLGGALRNRSLLGHGPGGDKVNCSEGAREGGLGHLPTLPTRAK